MDSNFEQQGFQILEMASINQPPLFNLHKYRQQKETLDRYDFIRENLHKVSTFRSGFGMAPIRRPNSRVQAIGKIRDMAGLPREASREVSGTSAADYLRKVSDPFVRFALNRYIAMEKRREQFFKSFGPILEGSGIHLSNLNDIMKDEPSDSTELSNVTAPTPTPRRKLKDLSFELVASKFEMPLSDAAKELGISVTTLALWCRINKIPNWPYRKLRRLEFLLTNMKEFGREELFGNVAVHCVIKALEEEKEAVMNQPSKKLNEGTCELIKKMQNMIYRRVTKMKKND